MNPHHSNHEQSFIRLIERQAPLWHKQYLANRCYEYWMPTQEKTIPAFITFLSHLYSNAYRDKEGSPKRGIPHIIHQIWLGGPLPERLAAQVATWKTLPGWHYILWDDAMVESCMLYNKKRYDQARNYAEKSDIARYEILYRFGGIYADCDTTCVDIQGIEKICRRCDFVAALEPLFIHCSIANAIIGSCPKNPILGSIIAHMDEWYILCEAFCQQENMSAWMPTALCSGAGILSLHVWEHAYDDGFITLILPPYRLYPCTFLGDKRPVKGSLTTHQFANSWFKHAE